MIRKEECFPYFEMLRFHFNRTVRSGSFLWVSQSVSDSGTSMPYL